ncbi:hypothetical protein G7Y89_g5170 [Cudoniella acicularis]|uniref:Uncharacterized protein n=1 Tax=Cudoniella acicularis TaxID=354080 RepID=A0A8H4RNT0_9HELO|nr:hypothetical protein G7Y89_g5170 [Cudoniella acicularis]
MMAPAPLEHSQSQTSLSEAHIQGEGNYASASFSQIGNIYPDHGLTLPPSDRVVFGQAHSVQNGDLQASPTLPQTGTRGDDLKPKGSWLRTLFRDDESQLLQPLHSWGELTAGSRSARSPLAPVQVNTSVSSSRLRDQDGSAARKIDSILSPADSGYGSSITDSNKNATSVSMSTETSLRLQIPASFSQELIPIDPRLLSDASLESSNFQERDIEASFNDTHSSVPTPKANNPGHGVSRSSTVDRPQTVRPILPSPTTRPVGDPSHIDPDYPLPSVETERNLLRPRRESSLENSGERIGRSRVVNAEPQSSLPGKKKGMQLKSKAAHSLASDRASSTQEENDIRKLTRRIPVLISEMDISLKASLALLESTRAVFALATIGELRDRRLKVIGENYVSEATKVPEKLRTTFDSLVTKVNSDTKFLEYMLCLAINEIEKKHGVTANILEGNVEGNVGTLFGVADIIDTAARNLKPDRIEKTAFENTIELCVYQGRLKERAADVTRYSNTLTHLQKKLHTLEKEAVEVVEENKAFAAELELAKEINTNLNAEVQQLRLRVPPDESQYHIREPELNSFWYCLNRGSGLFSICATFNQEWVLEEDPSNRLPGIWVKRVNCSGCKRKVPLDLRRICTLQEIQASRKAEGRTSSSSLSPSAQANLEAHIGDRNATTISNDHRPSKPIQQHAQVYSNPFGPFPVAPVMTQHPLRPGVITPTYPGYRSKSAPFSQQHTPATQLGLGGTSGLHALSTSSQSAPWQQAQEPTANFNPASSPSANTLSAAEKFQQVPPQKRVGSNSIRGATTGVLTMPTLPQNDTVINVNGKRPLYTGQGPSSVTSKQLEQHNATPGRSFSPGSTSKSSKSTPRTANATPKRAAKKVKANPPPKSLSPSSPERQGPVPKSTQETLRTVLKGIDRPWMKPVEVIVLDDDEDNDVPTTPQDARKSQTSSRRKDKETQVTVEETPTAVPTDAQAEGDLDSLFGGC